MKIILMFACIFLGFSFISTASADTIGNSLIDRSSIDGATYIAFIDPTLEFATDGTLDSFSIWLDCDEDDEFALQIYRPTSNADEWELVYNDDWGWDYNYDGIEMFDGNDFNIKAGDVVGWWFGAGGGVIPFTYTGSDDVEWTYYYSSATAITDPDVGDIYSFDTASWALSSQKREYSISVDYTPAPVPEPATMLLLGSGLVGIAGFRKRFKK